MPDEILLSVVEIVVSNDRDLPATALWTIMNETSECVTVLDHPLASCNKRLRNLFYWWMVCRRDAPWLRLWPDARNLWSRSARWYGDCLLMSVMPWPAVQLWTKLVLFVRIPWATAATHLRGLRAFMTRCPGLTHLDLHIELYGKNIFAMNTIILAQSIAGWQIVLKHIALQRLHCFKVRITCRIGERRTSRYSHPISDYTTYDMDWFVRYAVKEHHSFRVDLAEATTVHESIEGLELHLRAIYHLFTRALLQS